MLLIDRSKKIQDKWPEKSALAVACLYDISEENGSLHAKFIGNTKEHISNRVEWAKNGNIFIWADTNHKNPAYQGIFHIYYIRTIITKTEKPSTEKETGSKKGKGKKKAKVVFEETKSYIIDLLTTIEDARSDTISWDPTGRFFITGKLNSIKNSKFKIHDAKGDQLYSYNSLKLQQFAWRPRPVRNWVDDDEKAFKKEYKKNLRKKILEQDTKSRNEILELFNLEKEASKTMFLNVFKPLHEKYHQTKDERKAILKKAYPESDSEDEEEFERVVVIDITKR